MIAPPPVFDDVDVISTLCRSTMEPMTLNAPPFPDGARRPDNIVSLTLIVEASATKNPPPSLPRAESPVARD